MAQCGMPGFWMGPDERLDRVNRSVLLLQKKEGQCFSTDALLLSGYLPRMKTGYRTAELGCGSGVVSLLALSAGRIALVDAFEIQADYAEMAERNAGGGGFADRMQVLCEDVREACKKRPGMYRLVFANPPYLPSGGKACGDPGRHAARHEDLGGVEAFAEAAGRMLCTGGRYVTVCRPDRMVDLLAAMRRVSLEPKRLTFVLPSPGAAPCLFLTEGKKDASPSLYLTPPFHIRTQDGQDSLEYGELLADGRFPERYFRRTGV